jgi:hypothetical protein
LFQNRAWNKGDNKLGNTLAGHHREWLVSVIYEDDADFSTIVCVNSTGSIEHGNAVLQRQARPWPDLRLVTRF